MQLTEKEGRDILWNNFYEVCASRGNPGEVILGFKRDNGEIVLPTNVPPEELQKRRDELIGKDFKFTWHQEVSQE